MGKKLIINDEVANVQYNLRTTKGIMDALVDKAGQSNSVNVVINTILLSWKNKQKQSKKV